MGVIKLRPSFRKIAKFCMCGEKLVLNNTRDIRRKRFCSRVCAGKNMVETHPEVKQCLLLGKTPENRRKAGKTRSRRMKLGIIPKPPKMTSEMHRMIGKKMRGPNHWKWIEDRSLVKKGRKESIRKNRVAIWVRDVFRRDNYVCRVTGQQGRFAAHHIFNWKDNPRLRYSLNNGFTMLESLHRKFHSVYGFKNTNLKQLQEFSEVHGNGA